MKRVIVSATQTQVANRIVRGFTSVGCTNVHVMKQTDNYCQLKMTLPNGKVTTITAWYDYNIVKNGTRTKLNKLPWQPTYTVDPQGNVYDNGTLIGQAVVEVSGGSYNSTRKNYLLRSIRTDSGDVIIDHPEKANNYLQVVQTLQSRTVTHRS